ALSFSWSENGSVLGTTAQLTISLGLGTHSITLQVTDTHGASSTDDVVVLVTAASDTVPPVVQCPSDRVASADEHGVAAVPHLLSDLVASDNVTAAPALVKSQTPAAGTAVGCGDHYVTLTVTDAAGNTTTCVVRFTVSDTTPPVVIAPDSITRRAGA